MKDGLLSTTRSRRPTKPSTKRRQTFTIGDGFRLGFGLAVCFVVVNVILKFAVLRWMGLL